MVHFSQRFLLSCLLAAGLLSTPATYGHAAESCHVLMNGLLTTRDRDWNKVLEEAPAHMVHRMTPVTAPCKGFLTKDDVYIRSQSTDGFIVQAVFFDREFAFLDKLFTAKGRQLPRRIMDVGANTGLAARYLASRFPEARIVAIEPDRHNFAMATLNTRHTPNVHMLWGGVWNRSALLRIAEELSCGGEICYVVTEIDWTPQGVKSLDIIPSYPIDHVMQREGWDHIDFLKFDAECSEFVVFNFTVDTAPAWVHKVGCLSMEVHGWCHNVMNVSNVLASVGFESMGEYGELVVWCRSPSVAPVVEPKKNSFFG